MCSLDPLLVGSAQRYGGRDYKSTDRATVAWWTMTPRAGAAQSSLHTHGGRGAGRGGHGVHLSVLAGNDEMMSGRHLSDRRRQAGHGTAARRAAGRGLARRA